MRQAAFEHKPASHLLCGPDESFSKQIHLTMHGPLGGVTVITTLLSAQRALLVPTGFQKIVFCRHSLFSRRLRHFYLAKMFVRRHYAFLLILHSLCNSLFSSRHLSSWNICAKSKGINIAVLAHKVTTIRWRKFYFQYRIDKTINQNGKT